MLVGDRLGWEHFMKSKQLDWLREKKALRKDNEKEKQNTCRSSIDGKASWTHWLLCSASILYSAEHMRPESEGDTRTVGNHQYKITPEASPATHQTQAAHPVYKYWNSLFFSFLFYIKQRISVIYNSSVRTAKVTVTREHHCYWVLNKKHLDRE